MTEREIEAYLVEQVRQRGGEAYKFSSPARRGVPDRLVLLPGGSMIFVEVKSPRGIVSKLQDKEMAKLRWLGFATYLVRSEKEVDDVLSRY